MNCKVYITDEGFGPIVRQNAILLELLRRDSSLKVTLQLEKHLEQAKAIMPNFEFRKKYNNITWHKTADGFPDVKAIEKEYQNYIQVSDNYINEEKSSFNYDFIISDFVYEAFELAALNKVPSFGVAHFTWDWFFSKLYPPPVKSEVLGRFFDFASKAEVIYFPPFTPQEILRHYSRKAKNVPLIVGDHIPKQNVKKQGKVNVLIMDSGSGVLHQQIKKALEQLHKLKDFHFFISDQFQISGENITAINKDEFFIDYISQMDLVVGRAGFNTISECIALRTPMLLLSEAMNPEMNENIINIKHEGLGSFISLEQFAGNLINYLPAFMDTEYKNISKSLKSHSYACNGAEVIAEDILNHLRK